MPNVLQIATRKNQLAAMDLQDDLAEWGKLYFEVETTTAASSQKVQRHDLGAFLGFLQRAYGAARWSDWTPRVARDFQKALQTTLKEDGTRHWSDRTINRIMAHLKTWAKWIHQHKPFPLGNPMAKIKQLAIGNQLEIERAITKQERGRLLDASDLLLVVGGRSKDRARFAGTRPPVRKTYRAYRNRAIVYTLIESGMRRCAVTRLNLADIDFKKRLLPVEEKGGSIHTYPISKQAIAAIQDYIEKERPQDAEKWQSPALFLAPCSIVTGNGRLTPRVINTIWGEVCDYAGVLDKTPHSARHGMGTYLINETGNIAVVQRQLGHKNASFSLQYSRAPLEDIQAKLDSR